MRNSISQLMQQVFAGQWEINFLFRASQNRTTREILLLNPDIIVCPSWRPFFVLPVILHMIVSAEATLCKATAPFKFAGRGSFYTNALLLKDMDRHFMNWCWQTSSADQLCTTYTGFQELPPLGFKVKHHTSPGSWQSGASYQQDEQHDVGQGGGHPHYLEWMKWGNQEMGRGRGVLTAVEVFFFFLQLRGTFPEVFTPFQRLKYTMVKMRKRHNINCQRTPPTFLSPSDSWSSRTFLLPRWNTWITAAPLTFYFPTSTLLARKCLRRVLLSSHLYMWLLLLSLTCTYV